MDGTKNEIANIANTLGINCLKIDKNTSLYTIAKAPNAPIIPKITPLIPPLTTLTFHF